MTNLEKLTKVEGKKVSTDCAKLFESVQECVVENKKVGSLNSGTRDVGSDNVHHTVYARNIILCVKPDLLS